MIDKEVYDFLEHFGVKGMRWGQRRARRKAERTPWENELRRQRNNRRVGTAVVVALAGARIAMAVSQSSGGRTQVSQLPRPTVSRGASFVNSAIPMGPIGSTSISRLNGAIPL